MISVIGLGHAGTVTAASLAHGGRQVIASDIEQSVVANLASGRAGLVEPGLDALVASAVASRRLQATTDTAAAVAASSATIVCVGTPNVDGAIDLSQLATALDTIGQALAGANHYHLVIIRSTVLPGTTRRMAIPVLQRLSGRVYLRDFGVCHCPEFLREGEAIGDFRDPPKIVIGEQSARDGDIALDLFPRSPQTQVIRTDFESAEMLKYIDNAWHAMKVGFANEIGSMAKALRLDGRRLMADFATDTRLNISPAYLAPGAPYGGSCLSKDLVALRTLANERGVDIPLIDAIAASNRAHAERLARAVGGEPGERIGIIGAAFKAGSDDVRGSPYVALAESLALRGHEVRVHDRNIDPLGPAVRAWSGKGGVPRIAHSLRALVDFSDVLVLCHADPVYAEGLREFARTSHRVIDVAGAGRDALGVGSYTGICW
jgi:GDP-mannose 6-dehydrogenase